MPSKVKVTDNRAKKAVNQWLRQHNQQPIPGNVSYAEFASDLSRRISPRHAWKFFEDREQAAPFVRQVAKPLGLTA